MKPYLLVLAVIAIGFAGQSAFANDPTEAVNLKRVVDSMNHRCRSETTAAFDPADTRGEPAAAHCSAVFQVLESLCGSRELRKISDSVKHVSCGYGQTLALSFRDGTLRYQMVKDPVNDTVFIESWLKTHLVRR